MSCHFCSPRLGRGVEAAVVRVMNYTLAEGHDDEVPVIRSLKECPAAGCPSVRLSASPTVCQLV
ncbi:hypothetical protein KR067_009682, partial [Drosophila pandora]